MALNFNNINASEQILQGSITTPLFKDGAITSNKFGTSASIVIQDITYTAVNGGSGGNSITIQYIEDGIAGLETVVVTGNTIVVNIGNHTVLGSTATQVQTAITTSFAASLLVIPVITGTPSNIQLAVVATHLTGGITGAAMVTSLHADSFPSLVGDIQLVSGSNVSLSQVGQAITINVTGELSQALTNNHIFVGNVSNIATDVAMSGDASIVASGALTLATVNTDLGSFTLSNITVNAKGLVTSVSSTSTGNLTDVGTDGITITNGTGVVIGSGTSISQHVADTTHNGYLSFTDWNTFNNKQPAGSYITALTSDVSATGPGSVSATVNSVGGSSAPNIHSAELAANAATNLNTPSTIVKRDVSGSFSTSIINVDTINRANGVQAIDNINKYLLGSNSGISTVAWGAQLLQTDAGQNSIKWGDNNIGGTARRLLAPGDVDALDWTNRTLKDNTGTTILDWSTSGDIIVIGQISVNIVTSQTGDLELRPFTDSTTAIHLQSAGGTDYVTLSTNAPGAQVFFAGNSGGDTQLTMDCTNGAYLLFSNADQSFYYGRVQCDFSGATIVQSAFGSIGVQIQSNGTGNTWTFDPSGNLTTPGNINMQQNQLVNAVIQKGTSEPGSPAEGQVFYRTDTHQFEGWNGTSWVILG